MSFGGAVNQSWGGGEQVIDKTPVILPIDFGRGVARAVYLLWDAASINQAAPHAFRIESASRAGGS